MIREIYPEFDNHPEEEKSTVIDEIVYSDSRNEVKNLSGQFQQALRKAFYKHVHSGTEGNPSKIDLSFETMLSTEHSHLYSYIGITYRSFFSLFLRHQNL
jgi:hypothetical protein